MTKSELQKYIDMLPIGLYLGNNLTVKADIEAETSYFAPTERAIYLSLPSINENLETALSYGIEEETFVRSHLYHELSHAILTPKALKPTDIINTFEDERIETILRNYYHNTNFADSVFAHNGIKKGEIPPYPTTDQQLFYSVVRFHAGTKKQLEMLKNTINNLKGFNWNTSQEKCEWCYVYWVNELYKFIVGHPPTQKEWQQSWEKIFEELDEQEKQQGNGEHQPDGTFNDGQGDEKESGNGEEENSSTDSESQKGIITGAETAISNALRELIETKLKDNIDYKFYNQAEAILLSYQKKNNGGSAQANYSGRINPRNAQRKDFRYFDRKTTAQGVNPYGSLHLNLFIDNSGSYKPNVEVTNSIIATLMQLERKYNFFTFTVATAGEHVKILPKESCFIDALYGNCFNPQDIRIVQSMQKKDTFTYNILLQDGCGEPMGNLSYYYQPFDLYNCTMILDNDCRYSTPVRNGNAFNYIKRARLIVESNYTDSLKKNILETLQKAFR